jgi:hypothetical protein
MKSQEKTTRFNLVLGEKDTAVLDRIAEQKRWRKTDVLREALREYGRRLEIESYHRDFMRDGGNES